MSKKINIKLDFDINIESYLKNKYPEMLDYRIISKSLDARGAPNGKRPSYNFIIEYVVAGERFEEELYDFKNLKNSNIRPIIIGAGPAGLFAAVRLSEYGIKSLIIERGESAQKRMLRISKFWRYGEMDPETNVCYGEGGAGLFSDGKLITRIKSPYTKYVMNKLVEFGAPQEVSYISNPHLGSNKIRALISTISDDLSAKGHEFIYGKRVDQLLFDGNKVIGVKLNTGEEIKSEHIILATGHSAKHIYTHLHENKVDLRPKDFAVGVRIEHPRALIDEIQHGRFSDALETARYRLSHHNEKTDKGTYSFCMCPGGYVLSSGTEVDGIVVNGMSNYSRRSPWSNSALVVSVQNGIDFNKDNSNPLAGIDFCEQIEKKAFDESKKNANGWSLPAMTVKEFINKKVDPKINLPITSSPSKVFKSNLHEILPAFICDHLIEALNEFNKKIKGYATEKAILIAPETRTSAPVTIIRDKETLQSTSHTGLYPCGEGAGYAGGITSAAVDGVKVVEAIIKSL